MAIVNPTTEELGNGNISVTWSSFGQGDTCTAFDCSKMALKSIQLLGDSGGFSADLFGTLEYTFNISTAQVIVGFSGNELVPNGSALNRHSDAMPERLRWIAPFTGAVGASGLTIIAFLHED